MSGVPAEYFYYDSSGSEMDGFVYVDRATSYGPPAQVVSAEDLPSVEAATQDQNYTLPGGHDPDPAYAASRVPAELQEEFRVAVSQGYVSMARDLLDQGVAVHMSFRGSWSALVQACKEGCLQMIQLLLDHGMDPNEKEGSFTPLMAVCGSRKQTEDVLECCAVVLLKCGADPNLSDSKSQMTPLMMAAREGHCGLLRLLLSHGADIGRHDAEGWCAVSWAAYAGEGRSARVLLHLARPDPQSLITLDGRMPSDLASSQGRQVLSQMLLTYEREYQQGDADLVPDDKVDASTIPLSCDSTDTMLLSFLSSLDLEDLADTLREHGVSSLDALLRLDDAGLEKAGVVQAGLRGRLVVAIQKAHQMPWHKTSVVNLRSTNLISCPAAVSLVSNVRQHLEHLEGSLHHLWQHLCQQPQDLQLGRDLCSVRHLRDELKACSQGVEKLSTRMGQLNSLAMQVEGCPEYQQQWPALPGTKAKRHATWVPLLLLVATWWACKSSGVLKRLPHPPYW